MSSAVQFTERAQMAEPPFVTLVRLRARRRALWLRELWSADANVRNLVITHNEADRILEDPGELLRAEILFYESNEQAHELSWLIALADKAAEADSRWQELRRCFGLTGPEVDLLMLACAPVIDPAFGRAFGYLQDDATACYATQWLAAALFDWQPGERVKPEAMLARWHLASVPENSGSPTALTSPWMADPAVVQWLIGEPLVDPLLSAAIKLFSRHDIGAMGCLYPATLTAIQDFIFRIRQESSVRRLPLEIELIGPEGSGKCVLAAQLCAEVGRDMLTVDTSALFPRELPVAQQVERATRAARTARLQSAVIYYDHAETLDQRTRRSIEGLSDLTLFGAAGPTGNRVSTGVIWQAFHIPALSQPQRSQLWRHYTSEPIPEVIADWNLRPAEICAAALVSPGGPEAVVAACRRMLHHDPVELLTPLACPYTWDDIVLSHELRKQLEELCNQSRLRDSVLEEWGFERLCQMGRGISALFAGPSGTGKTMAAQVLARALNRELLRVDLAEVVNKYIGETEKRLKRVFEICERSAVVLFFDEADALFGQRTQVKDAHDRYANIQIDYLLQRMEQFDGIAILATNRKNDLDAAFLRRLRFIVDFVPPGPEERHALWRLALAERSPAGQELLEGIDWDWLAENLIMTGADIKVTALAAAFLARSQGCRIRMEHLLHAAKREMTKHGTAWRVGEWSPKFHA